MCLSKRIISFILLLTATFISGNVIPIPLKTSDPWIPSGNQKGVQSSSPPQISRFQVYSTYPMLSPGKIVTTKNTEFESTQSLTNQHNDRQKYQYQHQPEHTLSKPSLPEHITTLNVPDINPQKEDALQEKLGSSILASLVPGSLLASLPKPQDTENLIETDPQGPQFSPQGQSLFSFQPEPAQENSAGFTNPFKSLFHTMEQYESSQESSQEMDSTSDNNSLFSRVRNVLPFGSGLLSGLLSNDNNNMQEQEQATYNNKNEGHYFRPSADNTNGDTASGVASLFSFSPSQVTSTNYNDAAEQPIESAETGSNFLSFLQNPIEGIRNIFQSITTPLKGVNHQQPASEVGIGGYPGGSAITPLQSLGDGSTIETLKLVVPYLAHFISAFKITTAKLPLIKLLGAVMGPILAAAIAAMVIGLVYVSIYVSAGIARNEGVDGDVYIMSITQLLDILGILDRVEDMFPRSLENDSSYHTGFMLADTAKNNTCMEKIACHAIGRKLLGSPSRKNGWLSKGIRWIARNITFESSRGTDHGSNPLFKIVRNGKSLIDAIALGMEQQQSILETSKHGNSSSNLSCAKYSCYPVTSIITYFSNKSKN